MAEGSEGSTRGDDGFGPPHYLSGLYISHYDTCMGMASAKNLDRLILPLVHLRYCPLRHGVSAFQRVIIHDRRNRVISEGGSVEQ